VPTREAATADTADLALWAARMADMLSLAVPRLGRVRLLQPLPEVLVVP